jgi:hypothetical protein
MMDPSARRFFNNSLSLGDLGLGFIALLLAINMIPVPFVIYPTLVDKGPTWHGLDVSFQMTLNHANVKNWSWGNDIIATYGPLGFLSTRIGWGVSRWVFLLFDLFLVINFFLVFRDFLRKAGDKFLAGVIVLATVLLCSPFFGTDTSWVLLFFTCYWMYKGFAGGGLLPLVAIVLLTALSFYIKANTGLIILFLFAGYLVNLYFFKKISLMKAVLVLGAAIVLIGLLAFLFHVSIFPYIRGSLELIKGYNEVMYLEEDHKQLENSIRIIFWALALIFLIHAGLLAREKRYGELFFVLLGLIFIFLLKKQAFVRNDTQHLSEFISFACLIVLSGNLLSINKRIQRFMLSGLSIIVLLALFFKTEGNPIQQIFRARFTHKTMYWDHFRYYKPGFYLTQAGKRWIPDSVLTRVGNKTVDVFPWDTEYLFENNLNYSPRPMFQSFMAYKPYLEKKNYEFYRSNAPEYVLYDYDAIDERYPFNEESLVNLYLSRNYTLADTFTSNERWRILLQKKSTVQPLRLDKIKETEYDWKDEINVDSADFLKIIITQNLRGKYRAFRYKSPAVRIAMTGPDGDWKGFRTSAGLLKTGIMVERLVLNTQDFVKYLSQRDSLQPVVKLKLFGDARYFTKKIKIEYYRVKPD